ncbi:MAG: alpha-mannosidase [Acholeplasmataceae bacterium]
MSDKKRLHIIPHSHWDREWYMPFEQHRIRLVELMDTLIELMEANEDYPYFHLDGQYIILQDYLEIRPEMRERIQKLVRDQRLFVGPWYVLQDEYLTSGEANIRNLLLGIEKTKAIGEPLMLGYFPDSFGNISQAPQILNGFNIDRAVFGRGLSNLGPDNAVKGSDRVESELIWASPDGSEVTAILFANWYHNAMELPSDTADLKKRIRTIVDRARIYSTTDELLGMNGCDHQPIQTDLPAVIEKANGLFEDVEVVHSHFDKYFADLLEHRPELTRHTGEIAGQYTNGWYLLVSTASSRIHTKFLNYRAQYKLIREVEPILSYTALFLPRDYNPILKHNWLKLMENHPHDTICGCSNDRTHEDMITMLKRSIDISEGIIQDISHKLKQHDRDHDRLTLLNGSLEPVRQLVSVTYDLPCKENEELPASFTLVAPDGSRIIPEVTAHGKTFTYDLPDHAFRKPYYVARYTLRFVADIPIGFGVYQYRVLPSEVNEEMTDIPFRRTDHAIESSKVRLSWNRDGTVDLFDKALGKRHRNLNLFEDQGDRGNEYEFVETTDERTIYSSEAEDHAFEVEKVTRDYARIKHTFSWMIPQKLDHGKRSDACLRQRVTTIYTVYDHTSRVDVDVVVDNRHENHRLRALFPTFKGLDRVHAEGQYDIIARPVQPWSGWKNPSNLQRFETFVYATNEEYGLMVASKGLHEYEALRNDDRHLAITLLRSVGEIGDWGVFPTPDAQLIGKQRASYSIQLFASKDFTRAMRESYQYAYLPVRSMTSSKRLPYVNEALVSLDHPFITTGAIKPANTDSKKIIVRMVNLSDRPQQASLFVHEHFGAIFRTDLNEDELYRLQRRADHTVELEFKAKQIITVSLTPKTDRKEANNPRYL